MVKFEVLLRDWLQKEFPQYKAGKNNEIIAIHLPVDGHDYWRFGGGKWVASMRLDGTKFTIWHGLSENLRHCYLNITDREVFNKAKAFIMEAEPRQIVTWIWEPIGS